MALTLFNTLTGNKEPFVIADPELAKIYVCGPTVYDYSHLGHVRCYVVYDVLVRHLRATGQKVKYVRNITDVDDKIIKRAGEKGEDPIALAARFTEEFHADMAAVGNIRPDIEPKVSEHITHIIALIERIIENGHGYESDGDVYFDVGSFAEYGKLSHRKLDDMLDGASGRTDDELAARKRNAADFALWKKGDGETKAWDSPWGQGRPGWHIECSAMSMAHLGESFDLHGGGLDLVFPHHENEIAQSEAATKKPFSTCWMHNGFVEVDKTKMSKSLGNFFTAREIFKKVEPEAVRYAMLAVHYRSPLNFDWSLDDDNKVTGFPGLEDAERRVEYIYTARKRLAELPPGRIVPMDGPPPEAIAQFKGKLTAALNDDLNMPVALAVTSEFLKAVNELCDAATRKKGRANIASVEAALDAFGHLKASLALGAQEPREILDRIRDRRAAGKGVTPEYVQGLIEERARVRSEKNFERADEIRVELTEKGVELHDSPDGTTWSMNA